MSNSNSQLIWKQANLTDILQTYQVGEILGKGAFGVVRQGVCKQSGEKVAIKTIPKFKITSLNDRLDVIREIAIMNHVSGHPNVVLIKDTYEDKNFIHLILELCQGGELFDNIVKRGKYSEKDAAEVFGKMVKCVSHLHDLGVFHRDLKPENFLIDFKDEQEIKATDFGLSVFFNPKQQFRDLVGSPYYVAPEVLKKRYSHEADMWSLGVILFILLSGLPPFYGDKEDQIFNMILKSDPDFMTDPWPTVSIQAIDLIKRLLDKNPKNRPNAHEVLDHAWMKEVGPQNVEPLDSAVVQRMRKFATMNNFKKLAMIKIGQCLSPQEIVGIKQLFESIDTDGSGTITVDELQKSLQKHGHTVSQEQVLKLIEEADVDGDGTINYDEFLGATLSMSQFKKEAHMRSAFQKIDIDNSGSINLSELKVALHGLKMHTTDAEALIVLADKDGDQLIDYQEFVQMLNNKEDNLLQLQMANKRG